MLVSHMPYQTAHVMSYHVLQQTNHDPYHFTIDHWDRCVSTRECCEVTPLISKGGPEGKIHEEMS